MDIAQKSYPMVNYILSRMPSFSSPTSRSPSSKSDFDIEQPPHPTSSPKEPDFVDPLLEQMPHLKDPKVVAEMAVVVGEISQTRSVLRALGQRPDHESVDKAKEKVAEIEASLSDQLDDIALSSPRPTRPGQNDRREAAEKEKAMYKAVIELEDMHRQYEKQLRDAEQRLMKIYNSAAAAKAEEGDYDKGKKKTVVEGGFELLEAESSSARELVDEEVVRILENDAAGKRIERVNLSERMLKILPEAFGRLKGVVALDLSNNHLESIPDSIAGLKSLEEFNLSSNLLEALPDSIGLLLNLKVLNVSGNKLSILPDSICHCKSLVELDASYNGLTYLPTYLGNEMVNLRRLSVPYNKLNSLPTSIGQMKSLQHLEVHFNALRGLPLSIGNITNLETLNLSGNFSDLVELPATFGELINLKELDLSNNQIHALPDTFGRLDNLIKLNLDYNPITVPPPDVVSLGVQAVKLYMSQRWLKLLEEEEERNMQKEETESGWLDKSTTWMKRQVSSVSEYLGSPKSPRDAYLNEQL